MKKKKVSPRTKKSSTTEEVVTISDDFACCGSGKKSSSCGGCLYGLGFLGSAIYYVSTATSFWGGVVGILKSLVWPAFLVFELLQFLGA